MSTVTLPTYATTGVMAKDYEIDQLSFARSIVRQGKGARKAWRDQFRSMPAIPQSHEILEWNKQRTAFYAEFGGLFPMHSIRAEYRVYEKHRDLERLRNQLRGDPWAMIDEPREILLHTDEQAAPGSDDR